MNPSNDPAFQHEIDELRLIQQDLRESEARHRAIVESSLDAIITIDDRGTITEFNPAAEAIFGWTRAQVIGRDLAEMIIPPAMREDHRRGLERHRHSHHAPRLGVRLELSALRADGSEFPVELTVCRLAGSGQTTFTAFIRDLTERRQMEAQAQRLAAQLQASEAQYRSFFTSNPQPMCVYDPETFRFLAVNAAAVEQYGYSEAELLRMTIDALQPEEDRETWKRELFSKPLADQGRSRGRFGRKNGEQVYVEVFANDIVFDGRHARIVLAIDVTEQRSAAQLLRQSEARFRALTQLSADWYWEQNENLRFVKLESGGQYPSEFPPPETIIGKTRWELGDIDLDWAGWDEHRALLARREPFRDFEIGRRAQDGRLHTLSLAGSPVFDKAGRFTGYRGIGRDITERRREQEELHESQRKLAALMGNLPGMAYRCRNDSHWTLEFVSEGAHKLTGYRPEALVSGIVRYAGLIHPQDRERVWSEVQTAVADNHSYQLIYRITACEGAEKWVWERGSAARSAVGEVVALEGFVSDITERRRAQEEISRLNEELEERVRQRTSQLETANAELEAFSYSIAHDLRSPLTSIDGFSLSLEERGSKALDEQGQHFLRRIRAGVRQMSDLTDAMLSLANLSRVQLKTETIDLARIARSVVAQLREGEPAREVTLDVPGPLLAQGDPRLLTQIIANLVGNAWKFSAQKPSTHIRVGSSVGEKGEIVYFVADRGAGFDMTYTSRLFGAFQRLHGPSEFEGTGIGLALVQKIVSRHAGRIWAQAAVGEGATFYFTLAGEAAC